MTKNKVPHCHDLCTDTISAYVWGADLSGAIHGAGGVGGLLAVKRDGVWYAPLYDANGNVTAYVSETGAVVAEYEYNAFGATITQLGSRAEALRGQSTQRKCRKQRLFDPPPHTLRQKTDSPTW